MAHELSVVYATGSTGLYVVIINQVGLMYNTVSLAFESPLTADWSTYAIPLVESSTTGVYEANMPTGIADGYYVGMAYIQGGGSPVPSDSVIGFVNPFRWNGTTVVLDPTATDVVNALMSAAIPATPAAPGTVLFVLQSLNTLFQSFDLILFVLQSLNTLFSNISQTKLITPASFPSYTSRYGISPSDLNQAAFVIQVGDGATEFLNSPQAVVKIGEAEDWCDQYISDRISVPVSPIIIPGQKVIDFTNLTSRNYPPQFIQGVIYYAAGWIAQSEFSENSSSTSEYGKWAMDLGIGYLDTFVNRKSRRVGGGRIKHENPHMPPMLSPREDFQKQQ